jgi:hypothetical protein
MTQTVGSPREGHGVRITASVVSLSWIPPLAVEGTFKLPFAIGIAHYDRPPPDRDPSVDALLATDSIRFANELTAWIEVDEGRVVDAGTSGRGRVGRTRLRVGPFGIAFPAVPLATLTSAPEIDGDRVRFTQTAGGHTGVAVPHRIPRPPYWRITAPVAWSTVAITIRADGSKQAALPSASVFPRHYLYDAAGQLVNKTGIMEYAPWIHGMEDAKTPWEGPVDAAVVTGVPSPAERRVTDAILIAEPHRRHRLSAGRLLRERPILDTEVHVLLDGILVIELDGKAVSEVGPGAIFDPSRRTADSKARVQVRATTDCRLAVVRRIDLNDDAMRAVAAVQMARLSAHLAPPQ